MVNVVRPEAFGANRRDLEPVLRERLGRPATRNRFVNIFARKIEETNIDDPTADEHTDTMIGTVTINLVTRLWKGEEVPLASIYCTIPTDSDETWYAIRDIFRTARLGTDITGHPTPYTDPMKCATCHGVDHDTAMCKFPKGTGTKPPKSDARHDDGCAAILHILLLLERRAWSICAMSRARDVTIH